MWVRQPDVVFINLRQVGCIEIRGMTLDQGYGTPLGYKKNTCAKIDWNSFSGNWIIRRMVKGWILEGVEQNDPYASQKLL